MGLSHIHSPTAFGHERANSTWVGYSQATQACTGGPASTQLIINPRSEAEGSLLTEARAYMRSTTTAPHTTPPLHPFATLRCQDAAPQQASKHIA
jgi:hypothetical protein